MYLAALLWISSAAYADDPAPPPVDLKTVVVPGARLTYAVDSEGKEYDLVITMGEGRDFAWEMSAPVSTKGSIKQRPKALKKGRILHNQLSPGPVTLDNKTTSVFLSQKLMKDLLQAARPTPVYGYGPKSEPVPMGTFTGAIPWEVEVDGQPRSFEVELAHKLEMSAYGSYTPSGDEAINFIADKDFPLIVRMEMGFLVRLVRVDTARK